MKKLFVISLLVLTCALGVSASKAFNVRCGNVTYSFNIDGLGAMPLCNSGTELCIGSRTFPLSDVTAMRVTDDVVANNTVLVSYNGEEASVVVAGNVAQYVDVAIDGADIIIDQSAEVADTTCGEITYRLAGASDNGSFLLNGSYKATIELAGLTLTSADFAAIDIQDGKRIALKMESGTVNTVCDGEGGTHKAAIVCKGHLEMKGKGTLNVTGRTGHGIYSKEYVEIKNCTINVEGAAKDGLNCAQYFLMESGALNISNVLDDGLQCSYKDDIDREAEDTGTVTITGGKLNISVTADACKAIKSAGDFVVTGGTIVASVSGEGLYDTVDAKTKASSCISAGGNLNISGGVFDLLASGTGGKGISVDGDGLISGGEFTIVTEGKVVVYTGGKLYNGTYTGNLDNINSAYKSSPKGIKVDGDFVISNGTFTIWTKGTNGEGLESKKTLTIDGGDFNIRAYDDGTNSSSHTYINGGNIVITTGAGDAIDSNANIYVNGGTLTIVGAASPEQGFDAGDGYGIFFTGGTFLAACGGNNSVPSNSTLSTQAYVSVSLSVTAGQTVTVTDGTTEICSFTIPEAYSSTTAATNSMVTPLGGGGGGWNWGGPGGMGGGGSLVISCPEMMSGTSYTITAGTSTSTATAKVAN